MDYGQSNRRQSRPAYAFLTIRGVSREADTGSPLGVNQIRRALCECQRPPQGAIDFSQPGGRQLADSPRQTLLVHRVGVAATRGAFTQQAAFTGTHRDVEMVTDVNDDSLKPWQPSCTAARRTAGRTTPVLKSGQ